MADWAGIVDTLIQAEPTAKKSHVELRKALASGDTEFIREKVNGLKRLYPSTDWDAKLGLDELETRRLDKMATTKAQAIDKRMADQLIEAERLDDLDELAEVKQAKIGKQKALADRMRKAGMTVVKKAGPKMAALLGGPIGWGIAAGSTIMDAADAYAGVEATMNPQTPEAIDAQRNLAMLMRREDEDGR